jgi:hypothetical protein
MVAIVQANLHLSYVVNGNNAEFIIIMKARLSEADFNNLTELQRLLLDLFLDNPNDLIEHLVALHRIKYPEYGCSGVINVVDFINDFEKDLKMESVMQCIGYLKNRTQ